MKSFKPYANEADVLQIGGLQVENRVDRVTISGDIDLTADQQGLANARALHLLLADIVAHLESKQLPAQLPPPKSKKVDNPFA
ncbi:hypothetical protein E4L96_22215 [Massilia arenosa]|uniref:Uncharacterized protein n=1 Tax=Zemynaea arenosa TaxID=2561931 RepID=A0A4Y9RU60_9BURK|nr:hypothetical protein [Massilia arenosa]TFW11326.1 hypothetical protein E4L96_22215 [Massilia arenosa]